MQIIDATIAFAIGYYALRGYRLVKERTLFFLHFSFVLLGVGLLVDGIVTIPTLAFRGLSPIIAASYLLRISAEIAAYALLLFAYVSHTRSSISETTLSAMVLYYHPLPEICLLYTSDAADE